MPLNEFGQPVGEPLAKRPSPRRPHRALAGRFCELLPSEPERDAAPLFDAFALSPDDRHWTYLSVGPFADAAGLGAWLGELAAAGDAFPYTICVDDRPVGMAGYLRINPAAASIEVGFVHFSELLVRTRAATEAMVLMMREAFALGYRRYEWKCDAFNAASRSAAERLGFGFEGITRQATHYKGRTRDTAWFSVIDGEWPALEAAYARWLADDNFDAEGRQRARLSQLTALR